MHPTQPEADSDAPPQVAPDVREDVRRDIAHDNLEELEIEEEEVDLASYGEEPGDDAGFEELEEETRAAGGELSGSVPGAGAPVPATGGEPVANGEAVPESILEADCLLYTSRCV